MERPVILFIYDRAVSLDGRWPCFLWQAAEVGFRPYAVNWQNVYVDAERVSIRGGYEAVLPQTKRYLKRWESIEPRVVVHRKYIWGRSEKLIAWLAQARPEAFISFHPLWDVIGSKWSAELCFRAGAHVNLHVPRPTTYLVENNQMRTQLKAVGQLKSMIFKPSDGSESYGIWLSAPEIFDEVVNRLPEEGWSRYVAQEIVDNPVLYQRKRFDLRIYALVTCFHPLKYRVYHEGVVRVAAEDYDPACLTNYRNIMTGWSFLNRHGANIINFPISELLDYLRREGYEVEDFWERVDALLGKVFKCFVDYSSLIHEDSLRHRFFLTGADVMMVNEDDSFGLLFLETNDVPGLTPWGSAVDDRLSSTHQQWVTDLWDLCYQKKEPCSCLSTLEMYASDSHRADLVQTHHPSTVVLIDTGSQPMSEWTRGQNPDLVKIARVLSRKRTAEVIICRWYQLDFDDNAVLLKGRMLRVVEEQIQSIVLDSPKTVDVMLFYPSSGSGTPGETEEEREALQRFSSMDLVTREMDRNSLVARLMLEASRRGVVTNAPGVYGRWGRKDQLEFALRSYTQATHQKIHRPETFVVLGPQIPIVLRNFGERGLDCIIKPANGARGEGLQIIKAKDTWESASDTRNFIVQKLVRNPLLVNGHKADLRIYLLINTAHQNTSRRLSPVFVRLAGVPYTPGGADAEITNTAYRRRLGLPPAIYPLDKMTNIPTETRNNLLARINALADGLVKARFWKAELMEEQGLTPIEPNRVLLWGLDVAASQTSNGLKLYLLEVNVYPRLFRGCQISDRVVEDMLCYDYLPALLSQTTVAK